MQGLDAIWQSIGYYSLETFTNPNSTAYYNTL